MAKDPTSNEETRLAPEFTTMNKSPQAGHVLSLAAEDERDDLMDGGCTCPLCWDAEDFFGKYDRDSGLVYDDDVYEAETQYSQPTSPGGEERSIFDDLGYDDDFDYLDDFFSPSYNKPSFDLPRGVSLSALRIENRDSRITLSAGSCYDFGAPDLDAVLGHGRDPVVLLDNPDDYSGARKIPFREGWVEAKQMSSRRAVITKFCEQVIDLQTRRERKYCNPKEEAKSWKLRTRAGRQYLSRESRQPQRPRESIRF